jgi:hypothetical protein
MTDETINVLPDGSAFFTMSLPLPNDHWLYAPACTEWDSVRDEVADCPRPILTNESRSAVWVAAKYAIRASTMNGKDMDFDPDAMCQNIAYALCGACVTKDTP